MIDRDEWFRIKQSIPDDVWKASFCIWVSKGDICRQANVLCSRCDSIVNMWVTGGKERYDAALVRENEMAQ